MSVYTTHYTGARKRGLGATQAWGIKAHAPRACGPQSPQPGRAPVTSGVRARAPVEARAGGAPKPRRRARPDSRALGGRRGLSPARPPRSHPCAPAPARSPKRTGQKGLLLPNNSVLHSRNNASGEPESRGQGTGKREPGSVAPPAREPRAQGRARVRLKAAPKGEA